MLEIQILLPLLFRTDFPGYRGIQYVYNFFVFWVISNFFKCQKSHYSCHGLPVNSHANFTHSFPTLKIILIPTMTRSNHFLFIRLIACTGPLMPETVLLCGIDLLVARHTSKILLALLNNFFLSVHIAGRKITAVSAALKFAKIITLQQGKQQRPQMAQWTLGDFHINLQLPEAISYDHSFNRK